MGRELKRVPLDFSWPLKKVWEGYINPYQATECNHCEQSGLNEATLRIYNDWYSFDRVVWVDINERRRYNKKAHQYNITPIEVDALMRAGRLSDLNPDNSWYDKKKGGWVKHDGENVVKCNKPTYPTPDMVNEWAKTGFGHDAINRHICVKAVAKALKVYGNCPHCKGQGYVYATIDLKKKHDKWKNYEPPAGEGYQLWETTSEGSPSSPVFNSLDALCDWCADNATTFASNKATKDQWKAMLDDGFVYHQEGRFIMM